MFIDINVQRQVSVSESLLSACREYLKLKSVLDEARVRYERYNDGGDSHIIKALRQSSDELGELSKKIKTAARILDKAADLYDEAENTICDLGEYQPSYFVSARPEFGRTVFDAQTANRIKNVLFIKSGGEI